MTKLEELKAAYEDAWDAADAARDACVSAWDAACRVAAERDVECYAARDAYQAELNKPKEQPMTKLEELKATRDAAHAAAWAAARGANAAYDGDNDACATACAAALAAARDAYQASCEAYQAELNKENSND